MNSKVHYVIKENKFERCFVYLLNEKIIGFIDFSDIYDRLELNYIWVDPSLRGKGYSNDLMSYMFDYCFSNNNINNITLEVAICNDTAINLYKKYGFKKVALRKNYYDGIDAILMIMEFDNYE